MKRILNFFIEGFRQMTIGRKLWIIILIKLVIIFILLKLLFFPDFLGSRYKTDKQKADHVGKELILRK